MVGGHGCPRRPSPDGDAARHGLRGRHVSLVAISWRVAWPMRPATGSTSMSTRCPATDSSPASPRLAAGGRPGGGQRREAFAARLRPVEAGETRRAAVGAPFGAGARAGTPSAWSCPSTCSGTGSTSRGRPGPEVPPPRERARPGRRRGRPFARHWVHNGWWWSTGRRCPSRWVTSRRSPTCCQRDGRAYRLLVLRSHYRSPSRSPPPPSPTPRRRCAPRQPGRRFRSPIRSPTGLRGRWRRRRCRSRPVRGRTVPSRARRRPRHGGGDGGDLRPRTACELAMDAGDEAGAELAARTAAVLAAALGWLFGPRMWPLTTRAWPRCRARRGASRSGLGTRRRAQGGAVRAWLGRRGRPSRHGAAASLNSHCDGRVNSHRRTRLYKKLLLWSRFEVTGDRTGVLPSTGIAGRQKKGDRHRGIRNGQVVQL